MFDTKYCISISLSDSEGFNADYQFNFNKYESIAFKLTTFLQRAGVLNSNQSLQLTTQTPEYINSMFQQLQGNNH